MRHQRVDNRRRGAVVPLVAVLLVAMLTLLALAIDVGMITIAKTQAQNAADSAAMAGTRALNGDTANSANNNYSNAGPRAKQTAALNSILTKAITDAQCTVDIGSYSYDYTNNKFVTAYTTKPATENWSLVRAKIQADDYKTGFAKVIGVTSFNVSATATAIHRPRDVAIVLDVGGSMRYDSLLGIPHNGNRVGTGSGEASGSNNPETVYPKFGAYSDTSAAGLQRTTAATINDNYYNLANITVETTSGPAIVDHFYQNTFGATAVAAFTSAPDTYEDTPAGDMPKKNSNDGTTGTWVKTINDLSNSGTAPTMRTRFSSGGTGFGSTFYSYTQGPRYWGKTFFIWPPDPRTTAQALTGQTSVSAIPDWRQRFFGTTNNSNLFDSSGNWRAASGSTYTINYTEILKWIKMPYANSTATVFPPRLRSGRIIYYDAIPDTITGTSPTNANEKFWKRYIDYVLGLYHDGTSYSVITPKTGYGSDYSWGTPAVSNTTTDNPKRPRLHFWFGPMTMIDFLGNHNRALDLSYQQHFWWPGTCTESPNYSCKLGLQAALKDIERNHPNDYVSMIFFSDPRYSAGDTTGRFNTASVGMGRNYQRMIDILWFPQSTVDTPGTEVRYDSSNRLETPNAWGQTCFSMGFMLAYNQFSSNSDLRTATTPNGLGGGYGRRGANRLIVLETDGQANYLAEANFQDGGVTKSYYNCVPPNYPTQTGSGVNSQVYSIVDRIVAQETSSSKGYGTSRKPVLIHTVAYGTMFESYSTDPDKSAALDLLQNIQYKGNTQTNAATALQSYKIITGTPTERVNKMRQAFSTIMQDGVQISLLE